MADQKIPKLAKPSARYAKSFISKKYGQILVLRTTDPVGAPRMNVMFEVNKLGQVSVGTQYSQDDRGVDAVEKDFDEYDKVKAEVLVAETIATMIKDLREMKGKKEGVCLNCGDVKFHSNSFCSAECAREWRKGQDKRIKEMVQCGKCQKMVGSLVDGTCQACRKA